MKRWCALLVLLLVGLTFTSALDVDDDEFIAEKPKQTNSGSQILLEHSVDNGKNFGYRGKITYLTAYADELEAEETKLSQIKLSEQELTQLKNLIQQEGYYQVRVPISPKSYSVASIRADQITVHFGPQGASITRVDYSTIYGCGASTAEYVKQMEQLIKSSSSINWKTSIRFAHAVEGAGPNVNLLPEQQKEQAEQQQQQGSWLTRYWYIVLPVFLMMLMNAIAGVMPPEGQPGQQGQGGQRAPSQSNAAARRRT